MTIGERLKMLRQEVGISQEAMGAQGFISVPGWIKIEKGQRLPSDVLLHRLIAWLLRDNHIRISKAGYLLEELLTIKYMDSPSTFVRKLAYNHAKHLLAGTAILASEHSGVYRTRQPRGRMTAGGGSQPAPESGATGTPDAAADTRQG